MFSSQYSFSSWKKCEFSEKFIKTFPQICQISKLFRDDYHNLMKNIHPCCIHYSVNTLHLTVALLLSRPGKSNLLLDIRDTFCRCQVIWEKDEFFLQQKKLLLRNRVNIIKEKYIVFIFNILQLHIYIYILYI